MGRDKEWGTRVGDTGWRNSLGSQIGDVVLGIQPGGYRVVTLVWRLRLGDRLGTETGGDLDWGRGWGPRLGGQDLVTCSRGLRLGDPGVGTQWG